MKQQLTITIEKREGDVSEMITEQRFKSKKEERQFFEGLYWAGALIWAGLMFGAESLGLLPQIGEADAWSWVFLGVGLYGTVMNLYCLASLKYSNPTAGDYLWSGFWLVVGLVSVTSADIIWALALMLVGVVALFNALVRSD